MAANLNEIYEMAGKSPAMKLAVLAPEDAEFLSAIKNSWELGYIIPVLIGNADKIKKVSDVIGFNHSSFEIIEENDRQAVSNKGLSMLFAGKVDMVSKGQIPTAYVYKSVIKEEARINSGMTVCVLTMWEIPGLNRLVIFTDVGVNIKPDIKAKINTIKNAAFLLKLLGNHKPRICALSGYAGFGNAFTSYKDAAWLMEAAKKGELGNCEVIESTSLSGLFLSPGSRLKDVSDIDLSKLPDVLLVPGLDAGNILCKLDFILPVTRRSLVVTSKGPVIVPSRADTKESIVGEMAMGVVVCQEMKKAGLK